MQNSICIKPNALSYFKKRKTLADVGEISWYDFTKHAAEMLDLETNLIIPGNIAEFEFKAERPLYTVLKSEKRTMMPTLENALERFIAEYKKKQKLILKNELLNIYNYHEKH